MAYTKLPLSIADQIALLEKELSRSKDEFIKEHIAKYGKSEYPPAWKTLELATFGTTSKLELRISLAFIIATIL